MCAGRLSLPAHCGKLDMKNMIFGVDLGWVTQLETMGYRWLNEYGEERDIIEISKEMGVNAVRLRVFVNPPEGAFWQKSEKEICMLGFCDAENVLKMAKRVKKNDMKLMLDFHYSNHFADPMYQDLPREWKNDTDLQLEKRVAGHTEEVLQLFAENDIYPEWVQVGNEINNGLMWPRGNLREAPKQLVRFLNAGYDAVKKVCPKSRVITHLAAVCDDALCRPFLDNFFAENGKTDILGFSYYPYWEKFESSKDRLSEKLKEYSDLYHKPVMIVEAGGLDYDEEGSYKILADCIGAMREQERQEEIGVFYWEPEAAAEILPDRYPLCAAKLAGEKILQYNKALQVYRDVRAQGERNV